MRGALLGALALVAVGCRDSPREVVVGATEAAANQDIVAVKAAFSVATLQRLERYWNQGAVSRDKSAPPWNWDELSRRLLDTKGQQLEVGGEEIHGDYARVMAKAGVSDRAFFLRKEDGRWRLELGAGMRFREARAAAKAKGKGEPAKAEEKPKK